MMRFILVRHGHVEGIEPERFRGRADLSLTKQGEGQAQALAARIAFGWRPTQIYTSPARRCVATAAPIGLQCNKESSNCDVEALTRNLPPGC